MKNVAFTLLGIFTLATVHPSLVKADDLYPTNNDPARQIRFCTPEEADARRAALIEFVFSGGLPREKLPAVEEAPSLPVGLTDVPPEAYERADCLRAEIANWDYHAKIFLLHPMEKKNANRLVIVHQGHAHDLSCGVGRTADHLLRAGFTVAVMQMPLLGWNDDRDGSLPDGPPFSFVETGTTGHNEMFQKLAETVDGAMFRFFLEPVVQTVNHFLAVNPDAEDVSMVGLSGGGWTTSMAAALDTRIKLSIPVAGSAPLYVRNADKHSRGDAEQVYSPLFDENIAEDGTGGGVATWLEIYALGGYGENRRQIYLTNEFDSCCFAGRFPDQFKDIVSRLVGEKLGRGRWEHVLDSSHKSHLISEQSIREVINPALGIEPAADVQE